jgi:hypothetical protein
LKSQRKGGEKMSTKPRFVIPLANPKISDKLQFVVTYGSGRVVETSDKLKFVGHFHCILALLSYSPAVSFVAALRQETICVSYRQTYGL